MSILANRKHEIFAQELAKGNSQAEAYETAGYSPSEPHASRLASNGKVLARVDEIRERSVIRAEVTIASLLTEAADIQKKAMEANQHSAAIAALTAKAKLAGLWVDKAENTNRNVDPSRVTDAELAAVVQADSSTGTDPAPVNTSQSNGVVH